jgi:hypothetical protein
MRVRPASDLPSVLFYSRLFVLNLFSDSHDQHSIVVIALPEAPGRCRLAPQALQDRTGDEEPRSLFLLEYTGHIRRGCLQ